MERMLLQFAFAAIIMMIFVAASSSTPYPANAQTDNNSIQVIPEADLMGPATKLTVLIADGSLDANPNRIDEYGAEDVELVTFSTDRSEVGEAVPDIEETGENSGIFTFELQLVTDGQACKNDDLGNAQFEAEGGPDPKIGVCPGDTLSIEYEDPFGEDNNNLSFSVEIQSWDPEFAIGDLSSYSCGERISVYITDPDANRDLDMINLIRDIRVRSDSDTVGQVLSATETGENTGVFRLSFTTSSAHPEGNAIVVGRSDFVTVGYTDEFPADFSTDAEEKTFQFAMGHIGCGPPMGSFDSSAPEIIANGTLAAGKQATLSTVVTSSYNEPRSFIALLEIRDQNGVTVFLAWQGGNLEPFGQTQIGISWIPPRPDDYEIRTFIISDLVNPQVLSDVTSSTVTIS